MSGTGCGVVNLLLLWLFSAMKASEGKEGGGSAGGGGGGSVTVSQSEWDELQAANESLKASLAKMSKSNAQVRQLRTYSNLLDC